MIGRSVAHFQIEEKLGEGGMGEVYKARDTRLDRTVALKFLSEHASQDPTASARFLREAKAIAALNHPHICTIFETGQEAGRPFFSMEYMRGRTLRDAIGSEPLSGDVLLGVALQLIDALGEAHSKGILHRDLKPTNVFINERGSVKLLDFGLAKTLSKQEQEASTLAINALDGPDAHARTDTVDAALTQMGSTPGTVGYMSPEQVRGDELDVRSDLFSLGVVLYEVSCGRAPFAKDSPHATLYAIMNESPQPIPRVRPDVPAAVASTVDRLLQKDPDERFASARDVRDALVGATVDTAQPVPAGASLGTLGVRRSIAYIWSLMAAILCLTIGVSLAVDLRRGTWEWDEGRMFVWAGVLFLLVTPVVWWIDRRRSRVIMTSGKLTRFEEDPASMKKWVFFRWTIFVGGVASLAASIALTMSWLNTGAGLLLGYAIVMLANAAFLLGHFIGSRGLDRRLRSRCHRETTVELEGSFAEILARCSRLLERLGARVIQLDLDRGYIRAKTAASIKGAGEKITLQIRATGNGLHAVQLESDLTNPIQVFDWGKNSANIRAGVEALLQ